ncbi:hypothetical protein E2C01_016300 [Portunus trituberculatus]|uniref:Uncharacterized protein n=1 Tax=Portunus trituberculatus TaxID=210409 RepID=A0A5B7DP16_PORTR|nr:hypothetical protein [Portunus trituberculatus]
MASAALNSGLLEALVSRGGAVSQAGEGQSPSHHDPSAAHHAYLHAHFQGLASHYGAGGDLHDMSTSGGDVTTEEEDVSLSEHFNNYYRSVGDDLLSASAKKRRKQSKPVRLPTPQGQPADPFQVKAEESQFDSETVTRRTRARTAT